MWFHVRITKKCVPRDDSISRGRIETLIVLLIKRRGGRGVLLRDSRVSMGINWVKGGEKKQWNSRVKLRSHCGSLNPRPRRDAFCIVCLPSSAHRPLRVTRVTHKRFLSLSLFPFSFFFLAFAVIPSDWQVPGRSRRSIAPGWSTFDNSEYPGETRKSHFIELDSYACVFPWGRQSVVRKRAEGNISTTRWKNLRKSMCRTYWLSGSLRDTRWSV